MRPWHSMFPEADIFTLIADPESDSRQVLRGRRITQSFLARIPWSNRLHRHLLPLYPMAVEQLDLRGYDLVITSDAGTDEGGDRGTRGGPYLLLPCPDAIYMEPIPRVSQRTFRSCEVRVLSLCALCQGLGFRRCAARVAVCCQLRECVRSYSSILFTAKPGPLSTRRYFLSRAWKRPWTTVTSRSGG